MKISRFLNKNKLSFKNENTTILEKSSLEQRQKPMIKIKMLGTSLVVQWLRFRASIAGDVLDPWSGK